MTSLAGLLRCPLCRGDLLQESSGFRCGGCGRVYPLTLGFPDFRIDLPPLFDGAEDLRHAELLAAKENELSFRELMDFYYRLNPEASAELHRAHMAHFEVEAEHAAEAMRLLGEAASDAVLLDVGCGMGQYLVVGSGRFQGVVGMDLALFQLVLARKHLSETGAPSLLVAAEAERMPFVSGSVAAVAAAAVIEHVAEPNRVVAEAVRVLRKQGRFFLSTPNRFSLTPEPHVGVWGLGFLPHSWAVRYVRKKLDIEYGDIRLFSFRRLSKLLGGAFGAGSRVLIPDVGAVELASFSPLKKLLARLYLGLRRVPVLRSVLYLFAPFFQAVCEKR
jgi:ubiquinone/menaquinone biosynthesis C-methylase UbiE